MHIASLFFKMHHFQRTGQMYVSPPQKKQKKKAACLSCCPCADWLKNIEVKTSGVRVCVCECFHFRVFKGGGAFDAIVVYYVFSR